MLTITCFPGLSSATKAQSAWATEYADSISEEEYDSLKECPGYEMKQSDGEAPVILRLWGMQSTPLLPSFPAPLRFAVVAPDRVLSMSQKELNCVLMLNLIVWDRTVYKYKNGFGIE